MSDLATQRPHPRPLTAALLATCFGALAAGCASKQIDLGENLGFMEESAPTEPLPAHMAYPDAPIRATFAITEGRGAGSEIVLTRQRSEDDDRDWTITRAPADDPDNPIRRERIRYEDDGSILLLETHTFDRDVISRYEPPLILLPAELKPDEPHEQELTMTLHPLNAPDRERDRGDARNTITLVARQRIQSGGADFDALRIESVLEVDLRAADVVNKTDTWFVPETGMVAERYSEEARTFGVVVSSRSHLMVLRDIEQD